MIKSIIILVVFITQTLLHAQSVTTIIEGSFTDGLAMDTNGNIYGSDWLGKTVYKYDTNGVVTVFKDGFSNPNGIAINSTNEIYICDHTANTIYKYDTQGNELASFGSFSFNTPAGIQKIPNTDDMLVVEYGANKIKKLAANGTTTTLFSGAPLNGPAGITFIGNEIYIANFNDRKVFRFENNNSLVEIAQLSSGGATNNFLGFLTNINGMLLATQLGEHKVYLINPNTGVVTLYAGSVNGGVDGDLENTTFSGPNGILGDTINNKVFISDSGTKNLRIISDAVLSSEINQFRNIEIKVYPNPSRKNITINFKNMIQGRLKIKIFNTNGKQVFSEEYSSLQQDFVKEIKAIGFSKGIYLLKIEHEKGGEISKKIILN